MIDDGEHTSHNLRFYSAARLALENTTLHNVLSFPAMAPVKSVTATKLRYSEAEHNIDLGGLRNECQVF